jgi:hypothetical protein
VSFFQSPAGDGGIATESQLIAARNPDGRSPKVFLSAGRHENDRIQVICANRFEEPIESVDDAETKLQELIERTGGLRAEKLQWLVGSR